MQKIAADRMPRLTLSLHQRHVFRAFLRSPLWLAGIAVTTVGWACFLRAIANAPVSIVQPTLGAGLVLLALISVLVLEEKVRFPEWVGIALMISGIIFLGVSGSKEAAGSGSVSFGGLLTVTVGCLAVLVAAVPVAKFTSAMRPPLVLGFGAGVLIGLAALYTKGLFLSLEAGLPLVAWLVFLPLMIAANVGGVWVQQAGFQQGRALIVVAMNAVTNKVVSILGAMLALGEVLPADERLAAARVAGFVTILTGTVLLSRFGGETILKDAEPVAVSVTPR